MLKRVTPELQKDHKEKNAFIMEPLNAAFITLYVWRRYKLDLDRETVSRLCTALCLPKLPEEEFMSFWTDMTESISVINKCPASNEQISSSDRLTLHFHAVVSKDFFKPEKNHRMFIRAGSCIGSWDYNLAELNVIRDLGEHGFLVEGKRVCRKTDAVSESIPYKYVVCKPEKDKIYYEYIYNPNSKGHTNRCLFVKPHLLTNGGEWHQYDDVICPEPEQKNMLYQAIDYVRSKQRKQIIKGREIAGSVMLETIFALLRCWSKNNLSNFFCQLQQFYDVYSDPFIFEKTNVRWVSLNYGEKDVKELLKEFMLKRVTPELQKDHKEKNAFIMEPLNAAFITLYVWRRYKLDLDRETVSRLCTALCLPKLPEEEFMSFWTDMTESISVINNWIPSSGRLTPSADMVESLINRMKAEKMTEWIILIPLLHLLKGTSKPFQPVFNKINSQSEQSWAGLQGLDLANVLSPKNQHRSRMLSLMKTHEHLVVVDRLLARSWMYLMTIDEMVECDSFIHAELLDILQLFTMKCPKEMSKPTSTSVWKILGHIQTNLLDQRYSRILSLMKTHEHLVAVDRLLARSWMYLMTIDELVECDSFIHAELLDILQLFTMKCPKEISKPTSTSVWKILGHIQTNLLDQRYSCLDEDYGIQCIRASCKLLQKICKTKSDGFTDIPVACMNLVATVSGFAQTTQQMDTFSEKAHEILRDAKQIARSWIEQTFKNRLLRPARGMVAKFTPEIETWNNIIAIDFMSKDFTEEWRKTFAQDFEGKYQQENNFDKILVYCSEMKELSDSKPLLLGSVEKCALQAVTAICQTTQQMDTFSEKAHEILRDAKQTVRRWIGQTFTGRLLRPARGMVAKFTPEIETWNNIIAIDFISKDFTEEWRKTFAQDFEGQYQQENNFDKILVYCSEMKELSDSKPLLLGSVEKCALQAVTAICQSDLVITLKELHSDIFTPCYNAYKNIYTTLKEGSIPFKTIDVKFRAYKGKIKELEAEFANLCQLDLNDDQRWVKTRVYQIEQYHELHLAVQSAEVVKMVKETLGLQGDFQILDKLLNTRHKDFKEEHLDSIDDELVEAKNVLVEITEPRRLCLQELSLRKNFVSWVKQDLRDINGSKVFVDLASISAGENDMEVDRVACFHDAVLGYSSVLYDLNPEADFKLFKEMLKKLWKALDNDHNLPKKLRDSARHLEWLKAVKDSHGSVETSSMSLASAINMNGVYIISAQNQKAKSEGTLFERLNNLKLNWKIDTLVSTIILKSWPRDGNGGYLEDEEAVLKHLLGWPAAKNIFQLNDGTRDGRDGITSRIVHAPDHKTHNQRLHAVMKRLRECGLMLNPAKCQFCMDRLNFMGILLTQKEIGPTEERVRAVVEAREPQSA
ncbi:E3 ubiquitin-protein ligase RNF213-alpha-like protein [Labeo rohita]|uniref:E3 ubiquitin-protein ligase RNF213-alpha-like protein n=1 Tax=Labeo rohita TaxID=84645 RepID=A0A498L3W7_LABRO|nr:E3 ubiquitin-protein ligase RNF213-alpha-like protein [Labeo rohita]